MPFNVEGGDWFRSPIHTHTLWSAAPAGVGMPHGNLASFDDGKHLLLLQNLLFASNAFLAILLEAFEAPFCAIGSRTLSVGVQPAR